MSLLHLLGVDDDTTFDGKNLDKTIDNIKGYANNKFSEDEIDSANGTLEYLLSCAESIDSLENISNNVNSLVEATEGLVHSHISVYNILKNLKEFTETCDNNEMYYVFEEVSDALNHLNQELFIEIEPKYLYGTENNKFIKYLNFDFIPASAILNRSDKSGQVCYVSGDWEFEVSTYVGYGGLRITPKTIRYKHIDFCQCYDKIVKVGLDPQKLTIEDVQLLKIVDSQNELVYNLFVKNK